MAKVVTPITATVEHITASKDGQYGPYQSVLFKTPEGEKIWKSFNPDSPELAQLQKGLSVQLIPSGERNGRPSHQIVIVDLQQQSRDQIPTQQGLDSETKAEIAAYVQQMSKLYRFCWEQASEQLEGLAQQEESVKCAANSLFIAAGRKFGL